MKPDADTVSRKIRLRQLRCFVTVARMKSFVVAADKLGLTQPAISRSVRELEQILGHDLFDRSTRGAELTDQGRSFMDAAEAALLQIWQGTKAVVGDLGVGEAVRIGALPNVCSQFLPKIVASFKADYPAVRVVISPGTNAQLLSGLRLGETDLVIGRLSTSDDMRGLVFEALYDEPLVFVVRPSHALVGRPATLQEVAEHPLVLPPEGTIIRQEAARYFAKHGLGALTNIVETTSSDFQRAYVAATDSIAVIPRGVVQAALEAGTLHDLGLGDGELKGPVGLTTNPDLTTGSVVSMFLQRIRDHPLDT